MSNETDIDAKFERVDRDINGIWNAIGSINRERRNSFVVDTAKDIHFANGFALKYADAFAAALERDVKREQLKEEACRREWNDTHRKLVKKVEHHKPYTIVWWYDGDITRVKCADSDTYSEEAGFMAAICKRYFGGKGVFAEMLEKWCEPTEVIQEQSEEYEELAQEEAFRDGRMQGYEQGFREGLEYQLKNLNVDGDASIDD